MGNFSSTRRETSQLRSPSRLPTASQKTKKSVSIDLSKLAPKKQSDSDASPECPICFLNFEELNNLTCCSAGICTNCYHQLKCSDQTTCPFCSCESFDVLYLPSLTSNKSDVPHLATPESKNLNSAPSTSGASTPSTSKSVHIPLATVADRKELEKQISDQRELERGTDNFDRADRVHRPRAYSSPSNGGSMSSSVSYRGFFSSEGVASGSPRSPRSRGQSNRRRSRMTLFGDLNNGGDDIHDIIENDPMIRLPGGMLRRQESSFERLEELMIMEAIRQSLEETNAQKPVESDDELLAPPAAESAVSCEYVPTQTSSSFCERNLTASSSRATESEASSFASLSSVAAVNEADSVMQQALRLSLEKPISESIRVDPITDYITAASGESQKCSEDDDELLLEKIRLALEESIPVDDHHHSSDAVRDVELKKCDEADAVSDDGQKGHAFKNEKGEI